MAITNDLLSCQTEPYAGSMLIAPAHQMSVGYLLQGKRVVVG